MTRGLTINDRNAAINLLKKHSYFALISGYKSPFKTKQGTYKPHTSLDDIYSLYIFDDTLRTIILRNILKVEKHIKSLISYSFCKIHGEDQQHYLDATKYNYSRANQSDINDTYIHQYLNIPKQKVQYSKGKQDLFAVIIVLKYLLGHEEFSLFINDINLALETLFHSTKQLQRPQMYRYMGFPTKWIEIKDSPLGQNEEAAQPAV